MVVIDRDVSFGYEGALFSEVKAALFGKSAVPVYNLITGLGGRDVPYTVIMEEGGGPRRRAGSPSRCAGPPGR